MARRISWLHRLADIRRAAVNTSSSHFDRGDIEKLFQIQPSAAGKLMGLLPRSDRLGNAHLVARTDLVAFLEGASKADDVPAYLEKLKREGPGVDRRRKIAAYRREDGMIVPKAPERPGALTLERGQALLKWDTHQEYREVLLWALMRSTDDEDGFERDYCREKPKPPDRDLDEMLALIRKTELEFDAWIVAKRAKANGSSDGTSISPSM